MTYGTIEKSPNNYPHSVRKIGRRCASCCRRRRCTRRRARRRADAAGEIRTGGAADDARWALLRVWSAACGEDLPSAFGDDGRNDKRRIAYRDALLPRSVRCMVLTAPVMVSGGCSRINPARYYCATSGNCNSANCLNLLGLLR
jgi:hypothetical protein